MHLLERLVQLESVALRLADELLSVVVKVADLIVVGVDLRVQNELLTNHVQPGLIHVLLLSLVVRAQLHVFLFEQNDMLVASLVVVEERDKPSRLFVLEHFFTKNLLLQLHKVQLLLEVGDIFFVFELVIWVAANFFLRTLVLAVELSQVGL